MPVGERFFAPTSICKIGSWDWKFGFNYEVNDKKHNFVLLKPTDMPVERYVKV